VFILVRHAHAGSKKSWAGPDSDRQLSVRGRQQAAGLARNLSHLQGVRFLSSFALRCHQTVGPLAERFDRLIETSALLAPGADPAELDAFLDDPDLDGAVLCTHGGTLSGLIERWRSRGVTLPGDGTATGRRPFKGKSLTQKGAAWIVVDDEHGRSLTYVSPLRVSPFHGSGTAPPKQQAPRHLGSTPQRNGPNLRLLPGAP
jgi:phosphohistidine phosphatase SixA